jgi:preprotein translocase subunit SecG
VDVDAVTAAILGLSILLVSGVVTWKECLAELVAWNTLTWFATLIAMAGYLKKRKKKKKKVSDTSLATTRITTAIPKDHAENHAASQHDIYAAYHAHSAKDTYAITTNHAVESSATNAGIIIEMPHILQTQKRRRKYTAIYSMCSSNDKQGQSPSLFKTEKACKTHSTSQGKISAHQ